MNEEHCSLSFGRLMTFGSKIKRIAFVCVILCTSISIPERSLADLVAVSDADPSGTQSVVSQNDYLGIVDGVSPLTIGREININRIPTGQSIQLGDLLGRDIDATSGSRQWEYSLTLPNDAIAGTGFQDIMFSGFAFERDGNNLEGSDELSWELFVNNVSVQSFSSGPGVEFDALDVNLSNAGGAAANDVRVVFTITGFNGPSEWFATRGVLSASYMAIPESRALLGMLPMMIGLCLRRRKYRICV